jgi:hypothetical protein
VIEIPVTTPLLTVAVAVAPEPPPPVMVTLGAEVYPEPPLVILIRSIWPVPDIVANANAPEPDSNYTSAPPAAGTGVGAEPGLNSVR